KLLISSIEHESVLNPAKLYDFGLIPVDKQGVLQLKSLEKLLDDEVVLISVILASNELGTVQPIRRIAELIKQIRKARRSKGVKTPLYLHTDACQAPCYLDVHANRLGVDLMTLNGGKIYGPKQSGILFVKAGTRLVPQILGGGQQRNLRSGTENPASLIAFAEALKTATQKRKDDAAGVETLRTMFIKGLTNLKPGAVINGHPKKRLPHIVSVTFPGADNERLLFQLDEKGILAASGSACSASSKEPSHVLKAVGLSDNEARSTLRFSFGRRTTEMDIEYLLKTLQSLTT
ncbi:MAG TPA: aminotransferase class V-fold PLP-dependent enzyme, partial [Candidatus Saccharimonadales bacterium]|nr:aminotransferase class V-fold PLP-dependent enzyme [Candidatus Saccharimonadales bacterium]